MHQDGVNSLALALTAAFCGANQHDHGLSVRWALQGEGMALCILVCSSAAAPRFGAMWPCCSLVFSFAPSMPCRALHECNCLYLMAFFLRNGGKNT
ncbi:hypothetical protein B5F26_22965 [Escherichia coli]|nr:hypothetical protein [Salmonella enterica]ECA4638630.1 hypothetical protein [Salmonella enterica subsp. enterica serovar Poona]ECL1577052.1 hypothetical protein [Salmonella enterica subsp. enterica]ECZ0004077.1 hypothetical protein [Salmonella enterica subsp. enterica serovar Java]EDT7934560.1 hypothetical protein [Salmonella enterica subsp. enterica serovar 4,[5],12:i:-]EEE5165069.1 hypothetical protein [Salmonella enterica subsp. enterica serovar Reading]EEH2967727.1 hypothetical protein